jgi:hypothetical protein
MRKVLAMALAAAALFAAPAHAQSTQDRMLDDWTGQYSCGGTTFGITIRLDKKDGRQAVVGTINFYPVGDGPGEKGSFHTRIRVDRTPFDNAPGRWIVHPEGYSQIPLLAELVGDELHARFDHELCDPFVLQSSDAPGADPARIIVAKVEEPEAPPQMVAYTHPSWVGVWEGTGTCVRGPHEFILTIHPEVDENGNNATYEAIHRDLPSAERAIYAGVFGSDEDPRWSLKFQPRSTISGPSRKMPSFWGDETRRGLEGRTDELGCLTVKLSQTSTTVPADDEPIVATVPDELLDYQGAWDGGWFDEDGSMHQVSMTIFPSTTDVRYQIFDIEMGIDNRSGTVGLIQDRSGELNFVSAGNALIRGGEIRSEVLSQDGTDYFTFRIDGGNGFVVRRPEGQTQSLQDICSTRIDAWAAQRAQSRKIARDLKVAFHPAMSFYDEVDASLTDQLNNGKSKKGGASPADFATLAYQCLLTSPNYPRWVRDGIFDGVLPTDGIAEIRSWMQRFGEIKGPLTRDGGEIATTGTEQSDAETNLEAAVAEFVPTDVASILNFVESRSDLIASSRPSRLATILAPLETALDVLMRCSAASMENRIAAAEQRMSTIAVPDLPVGREDDFADLVGGRIRVLSEDQIAFFGGFVGETIETCDLPAAFDQRVAVSSILFSGLDRAIFGDGYATGDLRETLGASLTGTSEYVSGANAAKSMTCTSPYLTAVLASLVELASTDSVTDSGRASLFVRSCSLDRSQTQCGCIEHQLSTLFPNVSTQEYDRDYLARAIPMNPLVGIKLASVCQVGDY